MRHSSRLSLVVFATIAVFITWSKTGVAQNAANEVSLPECKAADLVIHFEAFNSANDNFNLATTGQNVSGHPCSFDSSIFDPTLEVNNPDDCEKAGPNRISYPDCNDCRSGRIEGKDPVTRNWLVNPGDTVRETFRWSTKPPEPGIACLNADWLSAPGWSLTAQSLLKKVCSDISVASIAVAPAEGSKIAPAGSPREAPLRLTTSKNAYNEGEFFSLRLSRNRAERQPIPADSGCPTLFVWHRFETGNTRTDEVKPDSFEGCQSGWPESEPGDWNSGFEVDSGAVSRWGGTGDHEIQVFDMAGPLPDGHYRLIPSNIVHIKTIDPTTIARTWSRTKGVGADITLDKTTYRLGEDVPLHMAIENFDADEPVYGPNPIWDPCSSVGLKVLDSAGHEVHDEDLFQDFSPCTGHGFLPMAFEKGKIYPLEWHLKSMGWLPKHVGTYTIVLSWCTSKGSIKPNARGWKANFKPYATAEATAAIHILDDARPAGR